MICYNLTRFNKIAIQGTPQMAVDKEAIYIIVLSSVSMHFTSRYFELIKLAFPNNICLKYPAQLRRYTSPVFTMSQLTFSLSVFPMHIDCNIRIYKQHNRVKVNLTSEVTGYPLAPLQFQWHYLNFLKMLTGVRVCICFYRPGRFPVDTLFERRDLESCRGAPNAGWYSLSRIR